MAMDKKHEQDRPSASAEAQDDAAEQRFPVVRSSYHRVISVDSFAIVPYSTRIDLIGLSANPNVLEQRVSFKSSDGSTEAQLSGVRTAAEYTDEAHFRLDSDVAAQMALNVLNTLMEMGEIEPEELQHNISRILKNKDASSETQ